VTTSCSIGIAESFKALGALKHAVLTHWRESAAASVESDEQNAAAPSTTPQERALVSESDDTLAFRRRVDALLISLRNDTASTEGTAFPSAAVLSEAEMDAVEAVARKHGVMVSALQVRWSCEAALHWSILIEWCSCS
jgi:hypothetical protein